MIEIKDLKKIGNDGLVIDQLTVKLQNGVAYGILDASGTGAHALLSMLAGVTPPDGGTLRINGFDVVKEGERARDCVGFLPRDLVPYPDLTPDEFLVFVAEAKNMEYEIAMHSVHELTGVTDLRGRRGTLCRNLTPGECKRLCLAQALMGAPEFLVADDPTHGLSDRDARDILDRLAIAAEGRTLLLGSTSLFDLRQVCDVILVLANGRSEGIYNADDRALDGLYARLCAEVGRAVEVAVSRASIRKKRSADPLRSSPMERDGDHALPDNDEK